MNGTKINNFHIYGMWLIIHNVFEEKVYINIRILEEIATKYASEIVYGILYKTLYFGFTK